MKMFFLLNLPGICAPPLKSSLRFSYTEQDRFMWIIVRRCGLSRSGHSVVLVKTGFRHFMCLLHCGSPDEAKTMTLSSNDLSGRLKLKMKWLRLYCEIVNVQWENIPSVSCISE